MNNEIIDCLDTATNNTSNIMVIGVGGGGGNAVKHMYNLGIHNVMFMVCNTDVQALSRSPIPQKIQLGRDLTSGLGAGNQPERGRDAAIESSDEIRERLKASGARMVFITAGMGGGTGTGAAPVIAEIAKELGILTVSIVTMPFMAEGPRRKSQAALGIEEIRKHVDSLLIIDNENISRMYGDLSFSEAFGKADDILATAAKGIAEVITKEFGINVDFADVQTTMSNSGIALMGSSKCNIESTDDIVQYLTENALVSPLLNRNNINGATNILLNISWKDKELKLNEVYQIISMVQASAGPDANVIWGAGPDETLMESGEAAIIIIATGFEFADVQHANPASITDVKPMAKIEGMLPNPVIVGETVRRTENETVTIDLEEEDIILKDGDCEVDHDSVIFSDDSDDRVVISLYDEPKEEVNEKPIQTVDDDGYVVIERNIADATISSTKSNNMSMPTATKDVPRRKFSDFDDKDDVPAFIRRQMLKDINIDVNSNNVNKVVIRDEE